MDISLIESNQLKINPVKFRLSTILPETIVFFTNFKKIVNKDHIKLINVGFPDNVPDTIFSDASRVQQVLYNLIGNAIKFTQTGHIKIGGKVEEGYALVYVEDTGIGVDPAKCDTIFHQFRQGEETITRTYGGTGLGLSISKGLIELLGGMIWVDLSYTAGSRFCFSLPTEESTDIISSAGIYKLYNEIQRRCIIITENKEPYRGILTNLMKSKKKEIPVYTFDTFQPDDTGIIPDIIIYDMPSKSKLLPGHISKVTSYFDKATIFLLSDHIEPEQQLRLNQSGCSEIFLSP
jgi:hypothetical protein